MVSTTVTDLPLPLQIDARRKLLGRMGRQKNRLAAQTRSAREGSGAVRPKGQWGLPLADRFFFEIWVPVKGAPAAALYFFLLQHSQPRLILYVVNIRFRKGGFAIMAAFAVFINENEIRFTGVEICDHIFCTDLAVCADLGWVEPRNQEIRLQGCFQMKNCMKAPFDLLPVAALLQAAPI